MGTQPVKEMQKGLVPQDRLYRDKSVSKSLNLLAFQKNQKALLKGSVALHRLY
jgi:hypothetical protein